MRLGLSVLAALLVAAVCLAKAARIPPQEMWQQADVVAIASVKESFSHRGSSERAKPWIRSANVTVESVYKGKDVPHAIVVDFDNGLVCPNVLLSEGERVLLILTLRAEGHYEIVNTYYGKLMLHGDLLAQDGQLVGIWEYFGEQKEQ